MEERRKNDTTIAEMLGMMRSMAQDIRNQAEKLLCVESKIDKMLAAFPEAGFLHHRLFHEKQIKDEADNHRLHQSLRRNIMEKGVWITIVIVAVAMWEYIRARI